MSKLDTRGLEVNLDPDLFMRKLLRELTGLLQDVVGMEDAAGYINSVGATVGRWIDEKYRQEIDFDDPLTPREVAEIFVDLKRRIGGEFYVEEVTDDRIVLGNGCCPFGDFAEGRDSLCMMTSNVFGRIAADHLGYARIELEETIARRDGRCRIVIHLAPSDDIEPTAREYYSVRPTG